VPNLFTVPGDVLAGAFLAAAVTGSAASPASLALAILASVSLYAAGLIDNDRVDFEEDLRERPNRPLPGRRITRPAAAAAETVLFAIPLGLAASGFMPGRWAGAQILLVLGVLVYNRAKAFAPRAGFILMGFCRGLNLFAGAALIGSGEWLLPTVSVAVCWAAYVGALTAFASHETRRAPGASRYLVAAPVAAIGLVAMAPTLAWQVRIALVAAALAGTAGVLSAMGACPPGPDPARVPRTVGRLVRMLIPMQALLGLAAAVNGAWMAAIALLGCWFLAARLGRFFYAS
jgi:4-hydroxybenzoate polyprenyltransferase